MKIALDILPRWGYIVNKMDGEEDTNTNKKRKSKMTIHTANITMTDMSIAKITKAIAELNSAESISDLVLCRAIDHFRDKEVLTKDYVFVRKAVWTLTDWLLELVDMCKHSPIYVKKVNIEFYKVEVSFSDCVLVLEPHSHTGTWDSYILDNFNKVISIGKELEPGDTLVDEEFFETVTIERKYQIADLHNGPFGETFANLEAAEAALAKAIEKRQKINDNTARELDLPAEDASEFFSIVEFKSYHTKGSWK